MSYLDDLTRTRDGYAQKLRELAEAPGHKITHREAGRTFNWQEYQAFLTDKISSLNTLIERETPPGYVVTIAAPDPRCF